LSWIVERHREAPAAFHARALPAAPSRAVWVCEPTGPALVLGSSQALDTVDEAACAAAGVDVVRRRSGGGAVLVEPGAVLWVDVVLPAGDPLWVDDVGQAFVWLGEAWATALGSLGVAGEVHRGALRRSRWSDRVCFAGLGTGEVTVPGGGPAGSGPKVVGLSQRRTRAGARFQCAALAEWDPEALVGLLALPAGERAGAVAELAPAAAGVGVALDALLEAFLAALP
jgi:lipoate-protein ligase A